MRSPAHFPAYRILPSRSALPGEPLESARAPAEGGDPSEGCPFRELVRKHRPFVCRVAANAGVPAGDVDDVAQAVLLVLWQQLGRGGPIKHVRAWLGTVTRRVAWAYHRQVEQRAEVPAGYAAELEERAEREAPSAELIRESAAAIRLVREVLEQLRPARREVFVRHELHGEPMPEIAAALRIEVMTGYSRLLAARKDFRRLLAARLRREERARRALLWPFLVEEREPGAGGRWGTWAAVLLFVLAVLLLDTPLSAVVGSLAAGPVSEADSARTAASPAVTARATAGDPRLPAAAPGGSDTAPGCSGEPGAAAASQQKEPARPAPPPRRRRNLEMERVLLDTAERMAAEGRAGTARESLELYSIHAPDNPMPATRASVEARVSAPPHAAAARSPEGPDAAREPGPVGVGGRGLPAASDVRQSVPRATSGDRSRAPQGGAPSR